MKADTKIFQLLIPLEDVENNRELIKRLQAPNYLPAYILLRRYVCRNAENPIAGQYYSEGLLVSYVGREKIAQVLEISPARVSQIFGLMQKWGDIRELSWDGRHKVWELGRVEVVETPKGEMEVEVFYFDLHVFASPSEVVKDGKEEEG